MELVKSFPYPAVDAIALEIDGGHGRGAGQAFTGRLVSLKWGELSSFVDEDGVRKSGEMGRKGDGGAGEMGRKGEEVTGFGHVWCGGFRHRV